MVVSSIFGLCGQMRFSIRSLLPDGNQQKWVSCLSEYMAFFSNRINFTAAVTETR